MLNRLLLLAILLSASSGVVFASSSMIEPNIERGQELFKSHCHLCHGASATGDGRMAKLLQTRPANLTVTILTDKKMAAVIRDGGANAGLSEQMPAWGDQFTAIEIQSLVLFINSLKLKKEDKPLRNSGLVSARPGLELTTR